MSEEIMPVTDQEKDALEKARISVAVANQVWNTLEDKSLTWGITEKVMDVIWPELKLKRDYP